MDPHPSTMSAKLTEQDTAILTLASDTPADPGEMLNRIRRLGLTEITFYQRLNRLLDTEAALAAFPITVNRLRRLRAANTHHRLGLSRQER